MHDIDVVWQNKGCQWPNKCAEAQLADWLAGTAASLWRPKIELQFSGIRIMYGTAQPMAHVRREYWMNPESM